jgi:DnaJ-class molecular chaperone
MTSKTRRCPDCNGKGRRPDTLNSLVWGAGLGLPIYPKTKTCRRCSGSGQIAK